MRAVYILRKHNKPLAFVAENDRKFYFASFTINRFNKDVARYDFWQFPPRPGEPDELYNGQFAKPEFSMTEDEIDWSGVEVNPVIKQMTDLEKRCGG